MKIERSEQSWKIQILKLDLVPCRHAQFQQSSAATISSLIASFINYSAYAWRQIN